MSQKLSGRPPGRPKFLTDGSAQVHIILPPDQARWLRQQAHNHRKPQAWVIRNLIEKERQRETGG